MATTITASKGNVDIPKLKAEIETFNAPKYVVTSIETSSTETIVKVISASTGGDIQGTSVEIQASVSEIQNIILAHAPGSRRKILIQDQPSSDDEATNKKYVDTAVQNSIGVQSLDDLTDVVINNPSQNQVIRYNNGQWVNASTSESETLGGLSDVTITSASAEQIIKYDGSQWVNSNELVSGNATTTPLTLKGTQNQSANLFELKNNSGDVIASITKDGNAYFNTVQVGRGSGNLSQNIAIGEYALYGYTETITGNQNLAIGTNALSNLTSGTNNIAIGRNVGTRNSTGSYNTTIGDAALSFCTSGSYNTTVGNAAGYSLSTGSYNTYIGYNAGPTSSGVSANNSIAIGKDSVVLGDNALAIGASSSAAANSMDIRFGGSTRISGNSSGYIGINNTTPTAQLHVINTTTSIPGFRLKSSSSGQYNPAFSIQDSSGTEQLGVYFNNVDSTLNYSYFLKPLTIGSQNKSAADLGVHSNTNNFTRFQVTNGAEVPGFENGFSITYDKSQTFFKNVSSVNNKGMPFRFVGYPGNTERFRIIDNDHNSAATVFSAESDRIGLLIKGTYSQTGKLFEVRDVLNTVLFSIAADGTLYSIKGNVTNALGSASISDLSDVTTSGSLTNGQFLTYDTNSSNWVNTSVNLFSGSYNDLSGTPNLATVATSGSYTDLANTPLLATVAYTGSYTDLLNRPNLSTVATTGSYNDLLNKPSIPSILDHLADVVITSPQNSNILQYDGSSQTWKNVSVSALSGTNALNDLSDVTISTPSTNQFLRYNGTEWVNTAVNLFSGSYTDLTNKPTIPSTLDDLANVVVPSPSNQNVLYYNGQNWVSGAIGTDIDYPFPQLELNDLTDTTITTPSTNQVLKYNGTDWVNAQLSYSDLTNKPTITTNLDDLSDVTITSPANNQVLKYDDVTGQWKNSTVTISSGTIPLDDLSDVVITSPVSGHILKYDGSSWVNTINTLSGNISLADGGVATPSLYFTNDTNTGLYRKSNDKLGFVANGQPCLLLDGTSGVGRFGVGDTDNQLDSRFHIIDNNTNTASGITLGNTSGKVNLYRSANNELSLLGNFNVTNSVAANPVLKIKGAASQSGNLIEAVNSAGTIKFAVDVNGNITGNLVSTLDALSDVTITSPSSNQILKYNGTEWVNSTQSLSGALDDLSDVVVTSPVTDQVLKYNGTSWVNAVVPSSGGTQVDYLNDLLDVTITSPLSGQLLRYNGSQWINSNTVIATSASAVPLISKGVASQTANLFEVQSSADIVASVSPTGSGTFVADSYFNSVRVGKGSGNAIGNTAIGQSTILGAVATVTGQYNTAVGHEAATALTTGTKNTFVGYSSGTNVTYNNQITGGLNAAVGAETLRSITSGSYNTVFGALAGQIISTGTQNTLIGYGQGTAYTGNPTGATALGYNTSIGDYAVAIGHSASAAANAFDLRFGGATRMSGDSSGQIGINKTAPGAQLHVVSGSASRIGMVVQGAASQTANIFEVRDSAGTVRLAVKPSGTASIFSETGTETVIGGSSLTSLSDVQSSFLISGQILTYNGTSWTNSSVIQIPDDITVGLAIQGAANQASNHFEIRNSSGIETAYVDNKFRVHAKGYTETVANTFSTALTPSSGELSVDTASGSLVVGALSSSVTTWAFTNVPVKNNVATTVTVIISGNSSYTYGDACKVNGTSVTGGILWADGYAPTATSNTDIISFIIATDGAGTVKVFGSATTNFS